MTMSATSSILFLNISLSSDHLIGGALHKSRIWFLAVGVAYLAKPQVEICFEMRGSR